MVWARFGPYHLFLVVILAFSWWIWSWSSFSLLFWPFPGDFGLFLVLVFFLLVFLTFFWSFWPFSGGFGLFLVLVFFLLVLLTFFWSFWLSSHNHLGLFLVALAFFWSLWPFSVSHLGLFWVLLAFLGDFSLFLVALVFSCWSFWPFWSLWLPAGGFGLFVAILASPWGSFGLCLGEAHGRGGWAGTWASPGLPLSCLSPSVSRPSGSIRFS